MVERALDGILVLDFSQVYAGPYAAHLLAQAGARVIKIEPLAGEPTRGRVRRDRDSYPVHMLNSTKEGVALDVKHPAGREIARALAARADVLLENFGPGTMDRLGLGYEALSALNPRLIYGSIKGFGGGPYERYLAMDLSVQAIGGVMAVTGFPDQPPVKTGVAIADFQAAVYLTAGIGFALYQRERTGRGQLVEVAMLDTIFPTLASPLSGLFEGKNLAERTGNRHNGYSVAPYNVYPTADGYAAVLCLSERQWQTLARTMGRADLLDDPRFGTNVDRTEHIEALDELIGAWTRGLTTEALVARLVEARVPATPVRALREVAADEHLRERGMVVDVSVPGLGTVPLPTTPIRLSASPTVIPRPAPGVGEHSRAVVSELLGLSAPEIERLLAEQALSERRLIDE